MAGFIILAEDNTDAEAIRRILRRRLQNPTVQMRSGKGCARVRRKAEAWLRTAAADGCDRAILLHDLDRDPQTRALNDQKSELSRGANRKPRYSTQDNPRLAEILDLELCASRCESMRQLLQFIGE